MEEYRLRLGDVQVPDVAARNAWFARWHHSAQTSCTAGTLVWMLGGSEADTAYYKDDYLTYPHAEVQTQTGANG